MTFAGVKEASAEGITLMMREGDKPMFVLWESLDLEALKYQQAIYAAYQKATSTRKVVPINMGYYENMLSEKDFLDNLTKALSKKHEFTVPMLSDFFEHKNDDKSFMSTSYGEDKNAAKRSERFVKDFTDLMTEFFRVKNPQLATNTITWTYDSNDPFVIVREATLKDHKSIQLSGLQVIEFFGNKNTRSRPRCSKYFSAYPKGLNPLIELLENQAAIIDDGRLIADAPKQANYKHLLNSLKEHLQGMQRTNTLSSSIERDCESFMREFAGK